MKLKRILLPIIAAASITAVAPAIVPQPAAAAGFMQNSLKNLNGSALDESVKKQVQTIAAFVYWLPLLALAVSGVAIFFLNKSDNEGGVKAVIVADIILAIICGAMWAYDSTQVGSVAQLTPQTQIALINSLPTIAA